MTPNQHLISIAFLSALSQLEGELPSDIQAKFNDIGKALATDPDHIFELEALAESYPPLNPDFSPGLEKRGSKTARIQ